MKRRDILAFLEWSLGDLLSVGMRFGLGADLDYLFMQQMRGTHPHPLLGDSLRRSFYSPPAFGASLFAFSNVVAACDAQVITPSIRADGRAACQD